MLSSFEKGQQLFYKPIHSFSLLKLEMLKIHIKINLTNDFIHPLKPLVDASIFFISKSNSRLQLCVDY